MLQESTMLALGTPAPDFSLPDVATGRAVSLADFASGKALLVVFLCAHCPYVVHIQPQFAGLARDYAGRGLAIVGITSNDIAKYPQDAPAPTAAMAREAGFTFPVVFDESQAVAKAYTAACTPDFFLFDSSRKLAYRGQLDSSRPSRDSGPAAKSKCDGGDLRAAIDATLAGRPASAEQRPSIGCNIKWKPGNEPDYFG